MKVKDLRKALEGVNDEMIVIVGDQDGTGHLVIDAWPEPTSDDNWTRVDNNDGSEGSWQRIEPRDEFIIQISTQTFLGGMYAAAAGAPIDS